MTTSKASPMMSENLKPCPFCGNGLGQSMSDTGESGDPGILVHPHANCIMDGHEVWLDTPEDIAAWNRRSGDADIKLKLRSPEDKEAYYLSIIADKIRLQTKHTALLDAVREVRDKLHRGGYAEHVSSRGIADTLTRIIDESEKQSVTKRVGTGSVTKTVTMTPDE